MAAKRVLSVGQCGADHAAIARTLERHFRADVVPAHTADEALDRLREGGIDLVLVNRVFDANGRNGLELIRQIQADEGLRPVPVLLVSNYDDAQREAVQAGARPGFGKAALGQPHMLARVRPFLADPDGGHPPGAGPRPQA
jgi:two-component system chemotaxis response regulator CheY